MVQENLQEWLLDMYGCDQFVLRYGEDTEVLWQGVPGNPPKPDTKRSVCTFAGLLIFTWLAGHL